MAYDSLLERQRMAFLLELIADPTAPLRTHAELMFQYLASLGFTQPTLAERLQAWAVANNVPQTLAYTMVGFLTLEEPFLDEDGLQITDEDGEPITL